MSGEKRQTHVVTSCNIRTSFIPVPVTWQYCGSIIGRGCCNRLLLLKARWHRTPNLCLQRPAEVQRSCSEVSQCRGKVTYHEVKAGSLPVTTTAWCRFSPQQLRRVVDTKLITGAATSSRSARAPTNDDVTNRVWRHSMTSRTNRDRQLCKYQFAPRKQSLLATVSPSRNCLHQSYLENPE